MDVKDRLILAQLDSNSRMPISSIAKKVGLSKDSVRYRIQKLVDAQVILAFRTIIDIGKLGYLPVRLLIRLRNASPEKERSIIDFMKSSEELGWLVSVEGYWDINTYFFFRSLSSMFNFYNSFMERFRGYIEDKSLNIYERITCFPRVYLGGSIDDKDKVIVSSYDKIKVDDLDKQILNILSENSRISVIEIARITGSTSKTIIQRIKNLEFKKVITGYRLHLDISRLGFAYYKVHLNLLIIDDKTLLNLKYFIKQNPNVIYWDVLAGGYDVEFEVEIDSLNKLRDFIDEIRSKFDGFIKDYEILHYYKLHYEKYYPDMK